MRGKPRKHRCVHWSKKVSHADARRKAVHAVARAGERSLLSGSRAATCGAAVHVDMDGGGSLTNRRRRQQIDVWADNKASLVTLVTGLADQVRDALDAANPVIEFTAVELDGSGNYYFEPDTKLHRVSLDFALRQD
jgi:hypothetical protein